MASEALYIEAQGCCYLAYIIKEELKKMLITYSKPFEVSLPDDPQSPATTKRTSSRPVYSDISIVVYWTDGIGRLLLFI
jgi:hypothetical protein